jgi:hypothetical protein
MGFGTMNAFYAVLWERRLAAIQADLADDF